MALTVREMIAIFGIQTDPKGFKEADDKLGGLKKTVKAVGAFFATGALALGTKRLLDLGSGAQETMNLIEVGFGHMTDEVVNWAKKTSEGVGRSEFMLREFAARTQAMLKPMVGSTEKAAEMSMMLSELAVDVSSFYDASEPDALNAMRSAVIGITEPLRNLTGVTATQAALQEFALSRGIKKSTKDMSEGEKAALRYEFILERLADAQGDATRTAWSYANASRRLRGQLKDVGTKIGQELLPAAEALLKILIPIVSVLGKGLVKTLRFTIQTVKDLVDGLSIMATWLGPTKLTVLALAAAFFLLGRWVWNAGLLMVISAVKGAAAWIALHAPLMLTIALFVIIAIAVLGFIDSLQQMGEDGTGFIATLIKGFWDLEAQGKSTFDILHESINAIEKFWAPGFAKAKESFIIWLATLTDAVMFMLIDVKDEFILLMMDLTGRFDRFTKSIQRFFANTWEDIVQGALTMVEKLIAPFRKLSGMIGGALGAVGLEGAGRALTEFGGATAGGGGTATATGGGSVVNAPNINIEVQASPGQSEESLADEIGKRTEEASNAQLRIAQEALTPAAT